MGLKVSIEEQAADSETENLLNDEAEDETYENIEMGCADELGSLAFSAIPQQRLPFDDPDLKCLIPSCKITLSIQDTLIKEKITWYAIELQHGCFRWSLLKRLRDFVLLHEQLIIYRRFLSFQMPRLKTKREEGRRFSSIVVIQKKTPKVPHFPLNAQFIIGRQDLTEMTDAIEKYLRHILKIPCFRDYHRTLEFLEIGPYSFIEDLGGKGKEGFVKRRSNCGDTQMGMTCSVGCGFWKKRWLFSKENFLALIDPDDGDFECVMLLDKAFRTRTGRMRTGRSDILVVRNLNRKLVLQCESGRQATQWAEELSFGLDRGSADFVTPNRYESFAPHRTLSECKWIVDGATYFDAVAIAMEAAKEEIFIADWWLSPEIYLRRPTIHGHYWQLDYLLRRKAREGVKIYVLLYKELELALGINSLHTEQKLSKMHPNIQVLRHPYVSKGVLLWAHHEKIVCIDQTYAFVGGIDLCYGRWDDFQHRLTDLGNIEEKLKIERHMSTFSGVPEILLLEKKASSLPDVTDTRSLTAVMEKGSSPDVTEASSLPYITETEEEEVKEVDEKEGIEEPFERTQSMKIVEGFRFKRILRKYQARKMFEGIKKQLSTEEMKQVRGSQILLSPEQPANVHRNVQEIALVHLGLERKFRLWHGKDYVNFINKDFEKLNQPYSDSINRNTTPRMPWHDVGIYTQGMIARDIARHFILRWNHAKEENCPKDSSKPYLLPKSYSTLVETAPNILQETVGTVYRAECQVLRSLCFWSANISDTESSIEKAYLSVIREAKSFIYIENQFFISQPSGNSNIYNGIANALLNRILKAHRERKDFRVYIVLPLLPAFEGEVGTGTGTLIQAITHWNYESICRGNNSLLDRLARHVKYPSKYIGFYGLRTHGILADRPVTELIYVHSKILIADDKVAIIGSANINDRSLLGRRDSEIAVIVKDTNFLDDPEGAGQFCYSLRTALFREHLGLMQQTGIEIDLRYPSNLDFFQNIWNKIAESNTMIYEKVFRCLPTDNVTTFSDLKKYSCISSLAEVDPDAAYEKLKGIQGYLVQFPLSFLCGENLEPHLTAKEHFLPNSIFT